jgi:hypothetical protein
MRFGRNGLCTHDRQAGNNSYCCHNPYPVKLSPREAERAQGVCADEQGADLVVWEQAASQAQAGALGRC